MKDFFSQNDIQGIIFDCDGVLVDSEKLSCGALNVIFEKYFQVDIGTDYSHVTGKSVKDGFKYYIETFHIQVPPSLELSDLYIEKERIYQDSARNSLKSFPGVTELIDFLKKPTFSMAVASSGSHEKINFNLTQAKLDSYFSLITSADEVVHGKPHPDLFLHCAQKIGVDPKHCLVIEDSVSGIKAAKAAKMLAVGVTNTFAEKNLVAAGADKIVTRLDELLRV